MYIDQFIVSALKSVFGFNVMHGYFENCNTKLVLSNSYKFSI